ncbi:hypothetical protein U9M48_011746 [Paspalum notatum var. saurae]|uniref:NB-ARC domain-containing protein n=1 Tax=Paspalum notatum var. saurae TaxID=547442 RepID=A0AAQ3WHD4_PASNO
MENPVVTASLGPMAPLLCQIQPLTTDARPRIQRYGDLKRLKEHLEVLCGDLLGPEETKSTPKWWRKEVRELLYDTEDLLVSDKAADLSEAVAGLEDACKIRQRLQLPPPLPNKTINPCLGKAGVTFLPLTPQRSSSSARSIIVVEEPMNKLVEQLAFDDHNQKQLKVVPILGLPGVGKTTAAATVYHRYRGKFQCSAFVRVSPTPDTRSLLVSILSQTKAPQLRGLPDVHDLFYGVKKHLKGKRFFIVMDDLWTASVWDIISRAFPDGDHGSRIITTTQIHDVALACCRYYPEYVLEMSPFNDDQSRKLFFTRISGSEDHRQLILSYGSLKKDKASYEIVKKCAGLPLAIVIVASLLARESNPAVEKLKDIKYSLPSILTTNHTFEGMDDISSDNVAGPEGNQLARVSKIEKWKLTQDSLPTTLEGLKQVLSFVYNNLPPHLLTCLLYLSMHPEGYLVRKHDLVRQWVAEGFVTAVGWRSAEAVAANYFDELVSSGMVQPVYTKHGSEVLSCTVHHMVLDLIRQKSKEMNFVITVDHLQSWLALPDEVRRLSLQFSDAKTADIPENILTSKIRSLLFSGFFECLPSLVGYLLLRVLILHVWADGDETSFYLTGISELLHLRYLKIQSNMTVNLPDQISGLKHLETLEVDASLSAVPSDIVHLKKLLHLLLPSDAILPQGIGRLTSLLTLGCFDLSKNSAETVSGLANLTNLQDLRLTWSTIPSEHLAGNMEYLGWILGKLRDLRFLTSHGAEASRQSICDDGLSSLSYLLPLLEKLELLPRICTLSRLPEWIGELSRLAILKIEVSDLSDDDFAILKGLTSLTALSLTVLTEHAERIDLDEGFPVLKYFKFVRTAPCTFSQGAMPNVQKLKLAFNANRMKPYYEQGMDGFKHMSKLTEVSIKFGGANADESIKENAERVFKEAFINHQNSLIFNIQWVYKSRRTGWSWNKEQ